MSKTTNRPTDRLAVTIRKWNIHKIPKDPKKSASKTTANYLWGTFANPIEKLCAFYYWSFSGIGRSDQNQTFFFIFEGLFPLGALWIFNRYIYFYGKLSEILKADSKQKSEHRFKHSASSKQRTENVPFKFSYWIFMLNLCCCFETKKKPIHKTFLGWLGDNPLVTHVDNFKLKLNYCNSSMLLGPHGYRIYLTKVLHEMENVYANIVGIILIRWKMHKTRFQRTGSNEPFTTVATDFASIINILNWHSNCNVL